MTDRLQMPHRSQNEGFVMSNEAQQFLNKGAIIIRMRGLPYECTPKQVIDFFREGDQSCEVYEKEDGILFVKKPDGKSTGDAFVQFLTESEASIALSKHKELIGPRYIELFRSTPVEVEQVLRKSQETKPRIPAQLPLIAPMPTPQVALPQRVITSGTRRDCIRLRGLPYEAQVEHILNFLGEHANNIVLQGVHMVYKALGQPSGEAFIQMDSEVSASQAASQCHYNKMHCGKKVRYVEVFQCSGDDMNAILNSGHLLPKTSSVINPSGIDNNIPGMALPLASTMLPYYEPPPIHMMPFIQNSLLFSPLALQQQNALAASFINKSQHKSLYPMTPPTYSQWSTDMDPYKPSTTSTTTTTDTLSKPKMTEAEILSQQSDIYSTYGTQPGVYFLPNIPRVVPNQVYPKPGFPTVPAPVIFPQVAPTLAPMGVLGVKRSWEQAFPLESAAAVQGAKRWQTPQVASFPTPGFFPDVG